MKSIQTKFIIIILAGILLSSMIIGGAGVYSAQKVVNQDSEMIMNLLCSEKAKELDNFFGRVEQSVDIMASYAIDSLESPQKLQDEEYREQYNAEMQRLCVEIASYTEGALSVYMRYTPELSTDTAGFFWGTDSNGGEYEEFAVTDLSMYDPSDFERVGWYYVPIENGKPTWLEPYLNRNINQYIISYVIPMYQDDTLIGIVGIDIDFNMIIEQINKINPYRTGYAFLTDMNGTIMYHRELERGTDLQDAADDLIGIADELQKGDYSEELIAYRYKGKDMRLVHHNLSNDMQLVITAPSAEIDREKNVLIKQILFGAVVICLFFIWITIITTRTIIRPLKELTVVARKIAQGDLSVAPAHGTKDEVGVLAESFRQTVSHLQKHIDYIHGLAYRDTLTGTKNKTAYQDYVNKLEERMRLGMSEFAVVVFDVNNLKKANDTYGHEFGDTLIADACKLISRCFNVDSVYRIGGDEFVVILEGEDYQNWEQSVNRFEQIIEEEREKTTDAGQYLSIAHGYALYYRETDLIYSDVFKRADKAMYVRKAGMKKQESANENARP